MHPAAATLQDRVLGRSGSLPAAVVSKRAVVSMSHLVEQLADADGAEARLVAGFQHERHWQAERERYEQLSVPSLVLSVDAREPSDASGGFGERPVVVRLPRENPVASEWFVLALGPSVAVLISCNDLGVALGTGPVQPSRAFRTLLTTDRDACSAAARDVLEFAGAHLPLRVREELATLVEPARWPQRGAVADVLTTRLLTRLDDTLLEAAERGRREERRRVAETLHDDGLQVLLTAKQDLDEHLQTAAPTAALAAARDNLAAGVAAVRTTVHAAYAQHAPQDALPARLKGLLDRSARRAGFTTELIVDPAARALVDDAIVACVRELVDNAARHAAASRVTVGVRRLQGRVAVEVVDDGVGASVAALVAREAAGHIGLALAAERIRRLGGDWELQTSPGEGFVVRVSLPV